jgi:hypothetical protein
MMTLNKYLNFSEEELGEIRLALIGNLEYNKLETTKKSKMTMLSDDKTKELSNKIYKHFKNNIR